MSKRARGAGSIVNASEACCAINSQDFLESFSSFWARVDEFKDSDFLRELRPKGGLARAWTVRGTMHTFPSRDYYAHVFGSGRKRILSGYERWARQLGIPTRETRIDSLYQPLMDEIKGKAVTSDYIKKRMMERLARLGLKSRIKLQRGWSSQATYGPAWTGITEMSYLGMLVSAGRKGPGSLWMRSSDWLNSRMKAPDPDDCVIQLMRKYIQRYGPVSRSDIIFWNNRLFANEVDRGIEELKTDLVQIRFEGSGEIFYSFGESSDFDAPPEAIILPEFDSLMMGYKDRSRFLSPGSLKEVSRPQGMISRTVLVDGFVSATWGKKIERGGITVSVRPFRDLNAKERRSIQERFEDYGDYQGAGIRVEFRVQSS